MHWEVFDKKLGEQIFCDRVNSVLNLYEKPYELSGDGQVLSKIEEGFESIFLAEIPSSQSNIKGKIKRAINQYRRHASTLDDRRQAVRELVDILELLRPQVKKLLTSKDEDDLFNIANNFGIRHMNDRQKTKYDEAIWLSWMFYFYLSTLHVVTRKIESKK